MPCKLTFSVNANSVLNGCRALAICKATLAGVRFWILLLAVGIRQCSSQVKDVRGKRTGFHVRMIRETCRAESIACERAIAHFINGLSGQSLVNLEYLPLGCGVPSEFGHTLIRGFGRQCGRRTMMGCGWIGPSCLGVVLTMASSVSLAVPHQDQGQRSPYTSTEYTAFRAADEEKNARAKINLLDDFSVKYPDSTLLPEIYRDYYLTYFALKNYHQTIEYADKFLALGDTTDRGDRLEALMTRAQAFFADCGDAVFQTTESYTKARTAAAQGLQTVGQFPIPGDCIQEGGVEEGCLPKREHLEALFYTVAGIAESGLKGHKDDSCISKKIEVNSIRLFGWQEIGNKRKYAEVQEFQETKDMRLLPSAQFELVCELRGEPDLSAGDFLVWATADFLVAPVTAEYEKMGTDQIGSHVGWGTIAEMQDFGAMPIYSLRPQETKRVVMKNFDLAKVLAAFPVGNEGNLWPWLIRLNVHVQDRTGRQIGSAERVVRLRPDSVRKTINHSRPPSGARPESD
jgi:hypothetical protein